MLLILYFYILLYLIFAVIISIKTLLNQISLAHYLHIYTFFDSSFTVTLFLYLLLLLYDNIHAT